MTHALRIGQLRTIVPLSKSRIYKLAQSGVFPPPIKLSERASAWLAHEVDAWVSARARGADDASIRTLVSRMVAQRTASKGDKHAR